MPKIKIIEANRDPLFDASGKSKVVVDKGFTTSIIENSMQNIVKIKVLNSEIKEDQEGVYEVAKIRIDSARKDSARSDISSAIQNGATLTNHQISIPKLLDINQINDLNITKATPSYSIECNFNYVSQDYDNLQISVNELNLIPAIDSTTKDEILNFRNRRGAKILDFSRGTRLKNFVQPQANLAGIQNEVPYFNRIQINSATDGSFSQFTQKIQIYDEILKQYLNSEKENVSMNIQDETVVFEDTPVGVYSVNRFFSEEVEVDVDSFYGLNPKGKASKMGLNLRKHLLKGYLKNVSKNGFRKFLDIYHGNECYKEGFTYSAEKYDSIELESAKIQTLFAPSGLESTRILDTQVKYGKTYVYKVSAHYLVVGNSYTYRGLRFFEEDGVTYATAEVINKPSYVIIPVELFSEEKTVIQPPPVTPQVTFRTENNSDNLIHIYLSPTKTETRETFIQITNEDVDQVESMDRFFKESDGKFRFKTTTQSGLYEVFRMENPPDSYSSFSDKKLGETRMPFRDTDAILTDKVEPNKFYYYVCRHLNEKELASNPTSVFKVMLVKDADDSKVTVETYMFPEQVTHLPSRTFKNILQVRPAIEQVIFNDTQDVLFEKESLRGTIDQLKLGITEKSVWGRKIKLRVKSKTSGKIIDLNIDFTLSKNKTKEEF
jgi:hypothetical protein